MHALSSLSSCLCDGSHLLCPSPVLTGLSLSLLYWVFSVAPSERPSLLAIVAHVVLPTRVTGVRTSVVTATGANITECQVHARQLGEAWRVWIQLVLILSPWEEYALGFVCLFVLIILYYLFAA